ncbi:hypothetical protein N7536_000849 [Penicillium majusculum]|nr:hypothetical protein N7536_000849 [Penicillium majusculum]
MHYSVNSARVPFIVLTILAAILLEGILMVDGGLFAMLKPVWTRTLADGKYLHQVYTGLPIIDQILAISVCFWDPVATNLPILRLQSIMLCAPLQTFAVWATIESMRRGEKHTLLRVVPIYVFLWQYLGTAIFFPFYLFVELSQHFGSSDRSDPSISYYDAKALLPATLLAMVLPYRNVYFPPSGTTDAQHHMFIAFYQLGPFATYILTAGIAKYISSGKEEESRLPSNSDAPWIKAIYAVYGIFSALAHIGVILRVAFSSDPTFSLSRLFFPAFQNLWNPEAAARRYVEEHLFFLQWDFILVVLGCSIYASRVAQGMYSSRESGSSTLFGVGGILIASLASMIFSPGAMITAILYVREDFIRQEYATKQRREKQTEVLQDSQ